MRLSQIASIVLLCCFALLYATPAQAVDVTLAWDPNAEPDLSGYGIYVSQGVEGPPYQLVGYIALSEFNSSESPTFTVTGLAAGAQYALAVTAYDADGNESYYSEPVCLEAGVRQIECAPSSGGIDGGSVSSGSGGGGGGGGGGCFLATSSDSSAVPLLYPFVLGGIFLLVRSLRIR